jgi:hypothetical protein
MVTQKKTLSVWDVLSGAAILAALVVMIGLARNDRDASSSLINVGDRQVVLGDRSLIEKAEKVKKTAADLKAAEKKVKDAQSDLEKKSAEMAETKREIEKLSAEANSKATKTREEIQESSDKLKIEREKLEQLGRDTEAKAKAAREDLERLEALRNEQRNAAQVGVLQGFGRGQTVDMQTHFDPRTQRGTSFHAPATNPAAVAMDNRLRWTETFFEMRRINKAARAREAGPRPTMEQIVKCGRGPRTLTILEVDPVTGDITWPLLLADPIYSEYTRLLQANFRQRADDGRITNQKQITAVRDTINEFKSELKANFANYSAGEYGKARNFLESLQQNYQEPAS